MNMLGDPGRTMPRVASSDLLIVKLSGATPGPWVHKTSIMTQEPGSAPLPETGAPSCAQNSTTETLSGVYHTNTLD